MKFLVKSLILLMTCCSLTACGSDDPEIPDTTTQPGSATVTPTSVQTDAEGGVYELTVSNQGSSWTAYATDACKEWVQVRLVDWTAAGGTVRVTVAKNSTGESRTGEVVVKSGSSMTSIPVIQANPLAVDTKELFSRSKGQTFTVAVDSYAEWSATPDADWISCTKVDSKTLSITTAQSDLEEKRVGNVVVASGNESVTIKVTQESIIDRTMNIPEGYALVWHDEFEEGDVLNSDWTHEVQGAGWVNNELQTYVNGGADGRRVTELIDGALHITCFKGSDGKIYSGRVYAKRNTGWKYGYFEARLQLPKGKGTWPAYWMMPVKFTSWPGDGEIDIMEHVGYHPEYCSSSIHCTAYNHPNNTQKTKERHVDGVQDEYHIYALEWTEDAIITYIDGVELFRFNNDKKGDKKTWPFNAPFYPIFNLAWGGSWGGAQGVDESALPTTFKIDYIRVFQKQ